MEQLNVPLLVFIAHRYAESESMRRLADAGHTDITLAQARLMARIDEGGSRLTELAESAQVTKQTAGYLVDQLERLGYVERTPDPRDARARLVRISAKGEEVRQEALAIIAAIEAEWTAHLGERRMAQLRAALESLREITDPYA